MREEPVKPVWCTDKLEEEIKVGLTTMLEGEVKKRQDGKESEEKTGEREKQRLK